MSLKIPDPWTNVLGASLVLLASSSFFHGVKLPLPAKEAVTTAQETRDRSPTENSTFSYVAASAPATANTAAPTATNPNLPPCPTPEQKGTGVLIEGDRPGETTGRKEKIETVAQQNGLKGRWCTSAKTGNATWNMDGISVDEAMKAFELFKAAGLVSLARPTDSPTPGKVTWQRSGSGGSNQNVSLQSSESPSTDETATSGESGGFPNGSSRSERVPGGASGSLPREGNCNCSGSRNRPVMAGSEGISPSASPYQRRGEPRAAQTIGRIPMPANGNNSRF
ncbi:hypothetical protein K9N68_02430 [Kovacikia minuta CCNUW1]|uniref:hypothetical protein n=1 Tax=Kovacikia minuta TaxID=2931930 RepID=UPI001CCFABD6|nr:hypothetical protein [Kovacikia minuta]UBF26865.1 hypothetical protein K9N68_02430 [Kovacikia minuta CCNUW1]